ncbi:MAG: tetratricopeptide repeat protein, partial [Acidobacteria bacterium]|nr:tetratricopeptide repeat protein [Acidobacteriota bacterium]
QLMAPGPFGNKEEARRNLEVAVARFAEGAPEGAFWWGEPEAHAFLGLSYAREKEREQARTHYERALELEPGFDWVRDRLLPELDSR